MSAAAICLLRGRRIDAATVAVRPYAFLMPLWLFAKRVNEKITTGSRKRVRLPHVSSTRLPTFGRRWRVFQSAWAVLLAIFSAQVMAQLPGECGSLQNALGPFDYRAAPPILRDVEINHFTANVEALRAGITGTLGGDIDYVLRAFPNHPRALWAMSQLATRENSLRPKGARYSADCYFVRAIEFTPDDGQVRLVYGLHLLKRQDGRAAVRELEKARELGGSTALIHYNLGLAYFEIGDFSAAVSEAKRAYELGFPLPGLRDKLKRAGHWPE